MKLRIKGDSLRLRVSPSEVQRLMFSGRIEETIHFAPGVHLTYALNHSAVTPCITVSYTPNELAVTVPTGVAQVWAHGNDVGICGSVPNGSGFLEIAIEKDFACLDPSQAVHHDTYPNPKTAC